MEIMFGPHKIEISPKDMARVIAGANNEEQGEFFNEFNKQLQAACEGSALGWGYQLIAIAKELDVGTEAMFAFLHREIAGL